MFECAWPWLLLCLPLPWLVYMFAPPVRQQGVELRVPFYQELDALQRKQRQQAPYWRSQALVYTLIWLLLVFASLRPQWHTDPQEQPRTGRDLFIAMDVSNSMLYNDMPLADSYISRMEFVKYWLKNFIEQRQGDRLGLILFGSQAYLQAPLTYDHHSIQTWVQEAQPGIAGDTTSIGDAIGLAIKRLREHPAQQRVLILVTDGANNSGVMSPSAAAQLAARYQIKIYTVGIGSQQMQHLHDQLDTSSLELDEPALREIAHSSGGQYFHVFDSAGFEEMQNSLDQLEPSASDQVPQQHPKELYPWPLAAALLLSMLLMFYRLYRPLYKASIARRAH